MLYDTCRHPLAVSVGGLYICGISTDNAMCQFIYKMSIIDVMCKAIMTNMGTFQLPFHNVTALCHLL